MKTEKKKILVMDDEKGIHDLFKEAFGERSFAVFTASTLQEGLDQIRKQDFSLLFLDVQLPDGSGLETLGKIRKLAPQMLVMVMTGHGDVEKATQAMERGANDYLTKPFDIHKLKHRAGQLLKIRALEEAVACLKGGRHG